MTLRSRGQACHAKRIRKANDSNAFPLVSYGYRKFLLIIIIILPRDPPHDRRVGETRQYARKIAFDYVRFWQTTVLTWFSLRVRRFGSFGITCAARASREINNVVRRDYHEFENMPANINSLTSPWNVFDLYNYRIWFDWTRWRRNVSRHGYAETRSIQNRPSTNGEGAASELPPERWWH